MPSIFVEVHNGVEYGLIMKKWCPIWLQNKKNACKLVPRCSKKYFINTIRTNLFQEWSQTSSATTASNLVSRVYHFRHRTGIQFNKKYVLCVDIYINKIEQGCQGGRRDASSPSRPKDVLTWHSISLKLIAKNIFCAAHYLIAKDTKN